VADEPFARLVEIACHDMRTPLATVTGFAKTMLRDEGLGEREARFVGMIDEASAQIGDLIGELALAAHIASGRYDPVLAEADTLELASAAGNARVAVEGAGATVETHVQAVERSLAALALAGLRYGRQQQISWVVAGRELTLAPLTPEAAAIVSGATPRDLGSLVARMVIGRLGGSLEAAGEALRVTL
jgi:signal transduction histidine kinase